MVGVSYLRCLVLVEAGQRVEDARSRRASAERDGEVCVSVDGVCLGEDRYA